MSVDQQDGYIAVGDTFRQFETGNVRQPWLDYREIEATGYHGLSRGLAAMGARDGHLTQLFQSSCDGLTYTVIRINDEKFQHSDRGPHRMSLLRRYEFASSRFKQFVMWKRY